MTPYKKFTLPNKLRVIFVYQPDNVAATVLVLVEAGSKYETKEINGLSHFLEHMCFKGTTKRPKSSQISQELDSLGASYNAFTSREYTGYYAKVQAKHVGRVLDIIPDLYLNPVFDAAEIDKERGVIIEEINMYEDLPNHRVQELFMDLLYGDQPAGWDVAGKKENILKLTREDFIHYRNKNYVASGTLVVVAGKFDEEAVLKNIEQTFAGIHATDKAKKNTTTERQSKPEVAIKFKDSDQTHVIIGVRAFPIFDDRRFALQVMTDILGGGMGSRLFQKIRDELGAAYYVKADSDLYTDHGYLAVAVGAKHEKLETVITAVLNEMKRLRDEVVDEDELRRAKDHLGGSMLLGLETSDSLASFYGGQEIIERLTLTPEQILDRIQAVTSKEILRVAKEIFENAKLNLALIGPHKDKVAFEKLLTL